jgi:hypothetical protein
MVRSRKQMKLTPGRHTKVPSLWKELKTLTTRIYSDGKSNLPPKLF